MSGAIAITQTGTTAPGTDTIAINAQPWLDTTEKVASVTATAVGTTDLTLTHARTNTATVVVEGVQVPIGKAMMVTVTGQKAGSTYTVRLTPTTDATPDPRSIPFDYTFTCS